MWKRGDRINVTPVRKGYPIKQMKGNTSVSFLRFERVNYWLPKF